MPVHDVAARGFGDAAGAYEQARPSYAPQSVAWLVEHLGIEPGAHVCDLAAGTGKLTRQLVPTGATLLAVEPVAGMRAVFRRQLPGVPVVAGTAEHLPLRAASLDAVTVAQAFHWFDPVASLVELHRVLRPGGRAGLVWNAWDDSVAWIARLHRVVADAGATDHWRRGHWSREWVVAAIDAHGGFSPVARAQFTSRQQLSRDGIVERVATTSHIASASSDTRARTLRAVREVLDDDPTTRDHDLLHFAYVVDTFWCERK
jgi:SAM-dependent methyltransferase